MFKEEVDVAVDDENFLLPLLLTMTRPKDDLAFVDEVNDLRNFDDTADDDDDVKKASDVDEDLPTTSRANVRNRTIEWTDGRKEGREGE